MGPWGWEERFGLRVQDFELWSFDGPRPLHLPSVYTKYPLCGVKNAPFRAEGGSWK